MSTASSNYRWRKGHAVCPAGASCRCGWTGAADGSFTRVFLSLYRFYCLMMERGEAGDIDEVM